MNLARAFSTMVALCLVIMLKREPYSAAAVR